MAKNVNTKTSKLSPGKGGLKSQIKTTRVASTKSGATPPVGGVGFRLAGNHNETFLK
jgi:hypothetical protein